VKASLHYCGETITQIAFGNEEADPCDCAETGNMDCCNDIVLKLKPFNDLLRTSNLHVEPVCFKCLVFLPPNASLKELVCSTKPHFTGKAEPPPPILQRKSDFLSVYRI
jgi:hypothetical protein